MTDKLSGYEFYEKVLGSPRLFMFSFVNFRGGQVYKNLFGIWCFSIFFPTFGIQYFGYLLSHSVIRYFGTKTKKNSFEAVQKATKKPLKGLQKAFKASKAFKKAQNTASSHPNFGIGIR